MEKVETSGLLPYGGRPKICAPLLAEDLAALKEEAERGLALPVDLWEWRADCFGQAGDPQKVLEAAAALRERLGPKPLLFTFRRLAEGGARNCPESYYFALLNEMARSGLIDFLDVELASPENKLKKTLAEAQAHKVGVILSSHDFQTTPASEILIARLLKMKALGAEAGKIAVTPRSPADVPRLLGVTYEVKASCPDWPIITIAMGALGLLSRLTGEVFGSAVTFGSAGRASAPGQIPVTELARLLDVFHKYSPAQPAGALAGAGNGRSPGGGFKL